MSNENKGKKKKGFLAVLLIPVALLVGWIQACNGNIRDALSVLSGGGAAGEVSQSNNEATKATTAAPTAAVAPTDEITPEPTKEATPEPTKEPEGNVNRITLRVNGKNVFLNEEKIAEGSDFASDSAVGTEKVSTALLKIYTDQTEVFLDYERGDYYVTEAVRKMLSDLAITPVEK